MASEKGSNRSIQPQVDGNQLDRFKQTARELGCDETGETFERAFAKAVPAKKPRSATAAKPPSAAD